MKYLFSSMIGMGALAMGLVLGAPSDASACGGCFHISQGGDVGQVVGHRMIFSVSPQATTLWDQIKYSGSPESFAWVLPIHGLVDIGLSSDALFETLEDRTKTQVFSPTIDCPSCNTTGGTITTYSMTGTATDTVTVIAQETVGPYETVQLSSADPLALEAWLDGHGYVIPADVVPIIDAYVAEGSDFLVMKLVPGQGVDSMRPVRVTSPGAGLTLPLRMVAAGTGAVTPITLWVMGEGRYEPTNFPSFEIQASDLTWDWDTQSSDYSVVKQQKFAATMGKGWLVEYSVPLGNAKINLGLQDLAANDPVASGYGADAAEAVPACEADLTALNGNNPGTATWVTRLHGELPKSALSNDLILGASAVQDQVGDQFGSYIFVENTKGTAPMCPPDNCGGSGGGTTGTGNGGSGANNGGGGSGAGGPNDVVATGGSCAVGGSATGFAAVLAALGLTALLRRRRRSC